jgi:hypothetical protein
LLSASQAYLATMAELKRKAEIAEKAEICAQDVQWGAHKSGIGAGQEQRLAAATAESMATVYRAAVVAAAEAEAAEAAARSDHEVLTAAHVVCVAVEEVARGDAEAAEHLAMTAQHAEIEANLAQATVEAKAGAVRMEVRMTDGFDSESGIKLIEE